MAMASKKGYLLNRILKHLNVWKPDLLLKGLKDRREHKTKSE